MLNISEELAGLKKKNSLIPVLKLSKNQTSFISREITNSTEDELWSETEQLREMFSVSFIELGRRLHELQQRYAKNKNGSFQKRYQDKGFKKTQVETLITKYLVFQEKKDTGCSATDIILIAEKLENASQRVTAKLKKAPIEIKEKFFNGEIKDSEIMDAEIIEVKPVATEKNIGCSATDIKKENINTDFDKSEVEIIQNEENKKIEEKLKELKTMILNSGALDKKQLIKFASLSIDVTNTISDKISVIDEKLENANNLKFPV